MPGFFGNFKPPPFNRFHAAAHNIDGERVNFSFYSSKELMAPWQLLIQLEPDGLQQELRGVRFRQKV
jgi:hypothetical protein